MKNLSQFAIALSFLFTAVSQAQVQTPVKQGMQVMRKALQCIEGRLPATVCRGDQFASFKAGSKTSREGLLAIHKTADKQQLIVRLFDTLDAQMGKAEDAAKSQNKVQFDSAIAEIHKTMNAGHSAFMGR